MATSTKNNTKPAAVAAPPKEPPTKPPAAPKPPSPSNEDKLTNKNAADFDALLDKSIGDIPEKPKPASKTEEDNPAEAAQKQADKAAEVTESKLKVRPPSKTHGTLPKFAYAGPHDGKTFPAGAKGSITSRDVLHRRYLNLIARPEGLDENTGRRVNTNRGPTCGGFASYAANNTGVPIIYTDSAYRVGEVDGGKIVRASDERREEVYKMTGGEEFTEMVVSQLGPDFTKGLPARAGKKEAVAA